MSNQQIFNQALALQNAGKFSEAEQLFRQLQTLQSSDATLHHCLGLVCFQQGRAAEAQSWMESAARLAPNMPAIRADHGVMLQTLGRFEQALAEYDHAIAQGLANADVISNRGNALVALGRAEEALAGFDRVLATNPRHVQSLNNRGSALRSLGRLPEALENFRRALDVNPGLVQAWINYSSVARDMGQPDAALEAAGRALALDAGSADAWNVRGAALFALQRLEQAQADFEQALARVPHHAEAWLNRGLVLAALQRDADALSCFDNVLQINPHHAQGLYQRALALEAQGKFADAMSAYEALESAHPGHRYALSRLSLALSLCDWPKVEALRAAVERAHGEGKVLAPLLMLMVSDDPALQQAAAMRQVADDVPVSPTPLWQGTAYNHDRIRIAYLSGDFHYHATAILAAELFEQHDRTRFEVIGVSYGPDDKSDMRARLEKAFDRFVDASRLRDLEVARMLREMEVDIVIDLKGHTRGARPRILAYRPAPVQAQYLGYPGTMGAGFVDYVIGDDVVTPERLQPFYNEQIVRLPHCYQPNDSTRAIAPDAPSREEAGLPDEGFVFCCFNSHQKLTAAMFGIWMQLLKDVPGSVLWLLGGNETAKDNLRVAAKAQGVDPARLVFAPRATPQAHLARHRLADLFLDTLPYNAHTTASDALWAGLPVLTLKGETFAARVSASLLTALELPELITENAAEYEAVALALARDPARLAALREKLAAARSKSTLFDGRSIAADLERAYARMWEVAQRGEKPEAFAVPEG